MMNATKSVKEIGDFNKLLIKCTYDDRLLLYLNLI